MNGASISAANGSARDGHDATPQSRRQRRERERTIVTGTRLLPNQANVPAEDHEPADDEGTDLAAITPPPRPAPRASAFRGLRYIESRKRAGQPEDTDDEQDDEPPDPPDDAAPADPDAEPGGGEGRAGDGRAGDGRAGGDAGGTVAGRRGTGTSSNRPGSAAAPGVSAFGAGASAFGAGASAFGTGTPGNGKRPAAASAASMKLAKLEPPRWPTPPVFMPPERPVATTAAPPRAGAATKPAVEDTPAEPAPAEPVAVEPVATEPFDAEPVAVEPVAVEPLVAEPEVDAEPADAEPVVAEPEVDAEPVDAEPVATEPVVVTESEVDAEPVAPEPAVTEPVATEPVVIEPVVIEPAVADPVAAEPVGRVEPEPDPIIAALVRPDAPTGGDLPPATPRSVPATPPPAAVPPDVAPAVPAAAPLPPPTSRREARERARAAAPATPAEPGSPAPAAPPTPAAPATPATTATTAATATATTATVAPARPAGSAGRSAATTQSAARRPAARTAPPGRSRARRLTFVLYLIPLLGTLATLAVLLYGAMTMPGRPLLGAGLVVAATAVLMAIVLTCVEANRATPLPLIGADLQREEHVQLWATVDAAAAELRVEEPIRIVVDGAARASMSRRPAGPELVIGLPLLLGLSEAELSAVLIHELAHDAAPGARVHRLGERVDATIRQLSGDRRWSRRPALLMIRGYARLYEWLATGANERHELRADDLAAELTSAPITASAIRRTDLIRDRWQILVTRYVPLSAVARRRAPLAAGLRSLLDLTVTAAPDADAGARLPFDAHLSAVQRAARLSATGDPATRSGPPATVLLAGGEDGLPGLERAVLPDDDPDADWQTIVQIAAELQAQERTGHLAWAMHEFSPHTDVTLRAVLAAVGAGDGPRIVAPLLRPGLTAQQRAAAAQATLEELLTAFVVTVLLRSGRALHEVTWPGAVRLLRRSGTAWRDWDGDDPIRSGTADPAGGAALNRWLREIEADLDAVALPSAGPPLHTLSALSDLELTLPFENRAVDLLIYRTGVLLAPIEVPTPAVRLAQQATNTLRRQSPARVAGQRIISIAEQLGESPQDLPGGWWIPLDTVVSGQIRERRNGVEITLRLTGGASSIARTTSRTSPRGTAMEDLVRLLPNLTGDRPASAGLASD